MMLKASVFCQILTTIQITWILFHIPHYNVFASYEWPIRKFSRSIPVHENDLQLISCTVALNTWIQGSSVLHGLDRHVTSWSFMDDLSIRNRWKCVKNYMRIVLSMVQKADCTNFKNTFHKFWHFILLMIKDDRGVVMKPLNDKFNNIKNI